MADNVQDGSDPSTEEVKKMLDVRQLEGWVTFPEAAEALGISKQGMHKLVFESPNAPFTSSGGCTGCRLCSASAATCRRARHERRHRAAVYARQCAAGGSNTARCGFCPVRSLRPRGS